MLNSKTRQVLPLGLAVALSLFGDLSLFAGLVTQLEVVHLSLAEVGILLSVHRLVRIPGNLVVGVLQNRVGRRPLFLLGMVLAVLSTAAYGLVSGFGPFLLARVAWGGAWALINVCGTTMVLDISADSDRGRLSGLYSTWVWVGYALGPLAGSLLTDALSFQKAMLICAACSGVGLAAAVFRVKETLVKPRRHGEHGENGNIASAEHRKIAEKLSQTPPTESSGGPSLKLNILRVLRASVVNPLTPGQLRVMLNLLVVNFCGDGVMLATLTLLLSQRLAEGVALNGWRLSPLAAGGIFIAGRAVLAGGVALAAGRISDGPLGRPGLLAGGLAGMAAGFGLLAWGSTLAALGAGLALNALGSGIAMALLPALLRDWTPPEKIGAALGAYAMAGDIGSTAGPVLAIGLAPTLGLAGVYGLCLGLLGLAAGEGALRLLFPAKRVVKSV